MKFDYDANNLLAANIRRTTNEICTPAYRRATRKTIWSYILFWM